jgi:hypothetical protein
MVVVMVMVMVMIMMVVMVVVMVVVIVVVETVVVTLEVAEVNVSVEKGLKSSYLVFQFMFQSEHQIQPPCIQSDKTSIFILDLKCLNQFGV